MDMVVMKFTSIEFLDLDCRIGHGELLIWSWKVLEKSWNFVSKGMWEPCINEKVVIQF